MSIEQFVELIKGSKTNSCLYHLTDQANRSSIDKHGILSTTERDIQNIKPCYRGGNEDSHHADNIKGIESYVCLSFTDNHPLCYLAKSDGRLPNPVYLEICPEILLGDGVMFADGVANAKETELTPIKDAIHLIDIDVIYKWPPRCMRTGNERVQVAKKCEILIPKLVPIEMIMEEV